VKIVARHSLQNKKPSLDSYKPHANHGGVFILMYRFPYSFRLGRVRCHRSKNGRKALQRKVSAGLFLVTILTVKEEKLVSPVSVRKRLVFLGKSSQ
jgi:hypothetical protein